MTGEPWVIERFTVDGVDMVKIPADLYRLWLQLAALGEQLGRLHAARQRNVPPLAIDGRAYRRRTLSRRGRR